MASLTRTLTPLRRFWARRTAAERVILFLIVVASAAAAVVFVKLGNTQTYVVAFTNMEPRDSAAAADQLTAQKIPYQVTPDGSTIKVPPDRLADARLKLAAKGLPAGGAVGFELFDKTSFGVTDFVQNVNYQRALEGELTRTIDTLDQVDGSRVHIVVPQKDLFISAQKPATASVVLRLKPGRSLDAGQLRGIAHMVSRSVEGLDEKNITILDTTGKMLYDGAAVEDVAGGLTATQIETQRKLEQDLENNLQAMLDRVTGPNRSLVRVKADLDFSQGETVTESYTPGGPNGQGLTRSSSSVQETYSGAGSPAGGQIPGASANLPTASAGAGGAAGAGTQYQRTETTTNYEITKATSKETRAPGTVKRLSVSVFLDNSISEQDAAGLRDAVAAAAGIDQKRGDQLVITTAGFSGNQPAEAIPVTKPSLIDTLLKLAKVFAPILLALIVLAAVWRMSRSVSGGHARATVIDGTLALPPAGGAEAMAAAVGGAAPEAAVLQHTPAAPLGQPLAPPAPDPRAEAAIRRAEMRNRLTELASKNPEAVATILQGWMNHDRRRI